MITCDELKYLVKEAVDFFRKPLRRNVEYYEDVAWDYARGILGNGLREDEKQNLYSKLAKKLNKEYKDKINFSEMGYKIEFSNNSGSTVDLPDEEKRAILLFLMDYNRIRFIKQLKKSRDGVYDYSKLREYIKRFLDAIGDILLKKESISCNLSYENAFECVKKLIHENTYDMTKENEYVAPAKILMLLNPNRFIAWDNQIAKRFGLRYSNCKISQSEYERFNERIDRFIKNNRTLLDCMVDYMIDYAEEYIRDNNPYEIKKLLDMIFWITYNRKNVSLDYRLTLKFYCFTEKLVEDHISTNENE